MGLENSPEWTKEDFSTETTLLGHFNDHSQNPKTMNDVDGQCATTGCKVCHLPHVEYEVSLRRTSPSSTKGLSNGVLTLHVCDCKVLRILESVRSGDNR